MKSIYIFLSLFCLNFSSCFGQPLNSLSQNLENLGRYTQIAQKISEIILKHSLVYDIDAQSVNITNTSTKLNQLNVLQDKIIHFIKQSKPIPFTLVGFPFKSSNTEKKVLGFLPDYAERLAFQKLQSFLDEIKQHYRPGTQLQIYTDGFAFCELLNVPINTVRQYEDALKQLIKDFDIQIITCRNLFPNQPDFKIQQKIKEEPCPLVPLSYSEEKILYKRLFKEFESFKGQEFLKKRSIKKIAQDIHTLSQKINHIYNSRFPNSIKLSVHYQKDIGKKASFSFSSGNVTPWHGVAFLKEDKTFDIRFLQDVPLGASLISKKINGIDCFYYQIKH